MPNRLNEEIKKRLSWELVIQSQAATPVIFILCLGIAYYQFNLNKYSEVVSVLMLLAALNTIFRYFVGLQGLKLKNNNQIYSHIVNWTILSASLNLVLWAATFWIVFIQTSFTNLNFVVAFMIAVSLLTASVLTLSYVPALAICYQISILSSVFFAFINEYFVAYDIQYLYIAGSIVLIAIYYVRQTHVFYTQIFVKYKYEVELESSLEQLKESNLKVIAETEKSQNASRLASLGEMAGGIAHEINNPLAIISGLLERVLWTISQNNSSKEDLTVDINRAASAVNRISRIIVSLLRIARKTEDSDLFENIKLTEIFDDVLNISAEKFKSVNISLELATVPDLIIRTKPLLVPQVLLNLLNNAFEQVVEFDDAEKNVKIYFKVNQSKVIVFVENSGPKIANEIQNKIFEPFFTTKTVGKGTGLGLSLCKGILESIGEQIWIDKNSKRTTFCFTLQIINLN